MLQEESSLNHYLIVTYSMYHILLIVQIKLSKVRLKYLSMNELAKSQLDITKRQEVSEKLNQILHQRSLCNWQRWDFSAAQMILPEMHIWKANEIWFNFWVLSIQCYLGKMHSGTLVIVYPLLCNISLNIRVKQ